LLSQCLRDDDDLIAATRLRMLGMRLAMGVLAAVTAWLLHAGAWPAAWLAAYALTQAADYAVFRRACAAWLRVSSLAVSSTVFSSLMVYNWFTGGDAGRVFAAVSLCCAMTSVVITLYPSRRYLLAALIPPGLCLVAAPLLTWSPASHGDGRAMAVILIGVTAYLFYLTAAARKLNGAMAALRATTTEAERLRRAAEAANAAKSNFLAVISHEIRTPMNAVVAAIALLRRTRLDNDQKAHLLMLTEAGDILLGLLNDVLDLSKMEAGKMTFETAPVDVAAMMANLQTLFSPEAQQKGLSIRTYIEPDVAPEVMSDPLRLRQILFNLVSNAVKFADKGVVRIRVRRHVGERGTARLIVMVEDEGVGIPAGDLERIFQSFEQGAAATSRQRGGSGMGLAISRRLARLMGGDLTARSIEGTGSCFALSLPYVAVGTTAADGAAETLLPAATAKAPPVHVLIVDDHEINRRVVSLFIEPLGWGWTMAENGVEAVELCHTRPFDVILMDMQMPAMDGLAATRAIRAERGPNQTTPIIALSGNVMDHHRQAWSEIGVDDFLAKPIDPEHLITTLAYKASGLTEAFSEVA
jgi:signal transduction histidine kinase/CheY-like chemotaxis protein